MNDKDFEKRLSTLKLASASDDYLEKGVGLVHAGQPAGDPRHRLLPWVLASALVLSVTANVVQLVNSQQRLDALEAEQLAQCNTPAAAASPPTYPEVRFATNDEELQPLGIC